MRTVRFPRVILSRPVLLYSFWTIPLSSEALECEQNVKFSKNEYSLKLTSFRTTRSSWRRRRRRWWVSQWSRFIIIYTSFWKKTPRTDEEAQETEQELRGSFWAAVPMASKGREGWQHGRSSSLILFTGLYSCWLIHSCTAVSMNSRMARKKTLILMVQPSVLLTTPSWIFLKSFNETTLWSSMRGFKIIMLVYFYLDYNLV